VLANIMEKGPREIFAAFDDKKPDALSGGGDVKYHLGYSTDRVNLVGRHRTSFTGLQPQPPGVS